MGGWVLKTEHQRLKHAAACHKARFLGLLGASLNRVQRSVMAAAAARDGRAGTGIIWVGWGLGGGGATENAQNDQRQEDVDVLVAFLGCGGWGLPERLMLGLGARDIVQFEDRGATPGLFGQSRLGQQGRSCAAAVKMDRPSAWPVAPRLDKYLSGGPGGGGASEGPKGEEGAVREGLPAGRHARGRRVGVVGMLQTSSIASLIFQGAAACVNPRHHHT